MSKIKTINLVYAISFLDLCAVGLTFPLFSSYLRDLGISHTTIGFLSSTYSGLQVLSGPIIGGWSDIRDRKSVLKSTLVVCAICYCLLGLTSSIFTIFILRFILGVTKHTQSICKAVITDLVPSNEQTGVFGRSAAYGSLGFIVGPFIGGHLSELNNGFSYVCALTTILFLINTGLSAFLPEDSSKDKKPPINRTVLGNMQYEFFKTISELRDIDWKEHWDSFFLRFLFALSMTCYFSNQAVYIKERYELSQKHQGYIISFFSTVGMLSAFFLDGINGFYKNDSNCSVRLIHFFSLMTFCFLGIYVSPNFWVFLVLLVPFSLACTALRVVSMELMLKKSTKLHRGSLSGASNSIMSIARFFAPLLTGIVSDVFSEQSVMLVAVVPAVLGIIVSLRLRHVVVESDKKP